jgi:hypothetical protein
MVIRGTMLTQIVIPMCVCVQINDEYCWVNDNQTGRESIRMDETTNPKTCTGGEPHVYYMPLAQLCLLSLHPAGRHRHARATA